ncbi:hypothetical protein [Peribacillus sp. Aquil_B1]|nr:hypothetical protein [Peribacillus sp. Aquil_B1]MCK1982964.1 hypothetical protein [Peribacillus sp. Aquil_B1]
MIEVALMSIYSCRVWTIYSGRDDCSKSYSLGHVFTIFKLAVVIFAALAP